MSSDFLKKVEKQNEIIISLLGRLVFNPEKIRDIVAKKKQNPEGYIDAYNACDGNHNVTEIAILAGVKHNTISPILQEWEGLGIIYEIQKSKGTFYKKIFSI